MLTRVRGEGGAYVQRNQDGQDNGRGQPLLYWIDWQAGKHVPVAVIDLKETSTTCPRRNSKMIGNGYRKLRCMECGCREDRDVIAILCIVKKAPVLFQMEGSLVIMTSPQMTDIPLNRCGEPANHLEGTLALQGGKKVSTLNRPKL